MSKITRRNFLKVSGVAAAAAALTACGFLHRKLRRFRRCIL